MRASALFAIVLSCCLVGVAGAVDTFTVDVEAVEATTVPPGGSTTLRIVGSLTEEDNLGLAFFAYGLRVTGPRAVNLETAAVFDPPLPGVQPDAESFHKDWGFSIVDPVTFEDMFNGVPVVDTLVQLGGGQNTINNDPFSPPGVQYPSGAVVEGLGHGDGAVLHQFQLTLPAEANDLEEYTVEIIPDPDGVVANMMTDKTGDVPPKWTVEQVDTVIGASVTIIIQECTTTPEVLHATAGPGETTPCTGYIDPRIESNDGTNHNEGIDRVTFVFSEPVQPVGGGVMEDCISCFEVSETDTGGQPPNSVSDVNVVDSTTVEVVLDRLITLQEWTTVRAIVENTCGNGILNQGNLGPGVAEPDRIDVAALPGDMNQDEQVTPQDLINLRQFLTAGSYHNDCDDMLYFDVDRDGAVAPLDLIRFRQMLAGTSPATRVWTLEQVVPDQP